MKSITIHNLDEHMASLIKRISQKEGVSQNKTIKNLLRRALGITDMNDPKLRTEYEDLFGIWAEKDFEEFQKCISELDKVDPKDWL